MSTCLVPRPVPPKGGDYTGVVPVRVIRYAPEDQEVADIRRAWEASAHGDWFRVARIRAAGAV